MSMCDECKATCSNCGKPEVKGFGMCNNCYRYFKRNGTMRPLDEKVLKSRLKYPECSNCGKKNPGGHNTKFQHGLCHSCLIFYRKHGRHSTEQERNRYGQNKTICIDCKTRPAYAKKRCNRCYLYWQRTGKKRPRRLDTEICINCGIPLQSAKTLTGLCRKCYRYRAQFKRDRPEHLWQRGQYGYCDCGQPATHKATVQVHRHIEEMPLCDECNAEYQRQVQWYGDGKPTGNLQQGKRIDVYGDD